jgi:DNA-binding transcriptional LysR family regulator
MKRDDLNDLAAFVMIADERSFTRAAARLGMSPSALSHAMKALEARLGVRLLARTTRSVATTEAGERLLRTLRPAFQDIGAELTALGELRDKPAGTIRITAFKHAAVSVLWPVLPDFLAAYPDVRVEIAVEDGLTDIVAGRFDAGIRFGENVEKDMIAVRISPDIRFSAVGSPAYFANYPPPLVPADLARHHCINYRMATSGGIYAWEFEEAGRPFQMKVDGPLVFNDGDLMRMAALAGQGIALCYEDEIAEAVADGRLVRVLEAWCPTVPGCYLYYSSRRQTPPALVALIEALRARLSAVAPRARIG